MFLLVFLINLRFLSEIRLILRKNTCRNSSSRSRYSIVFFLRMIFIRPNTRLLDGGIFYHISFFYFIISWGDSQV